MIGANAPLYIPLVITRTLPTFAAAPGSPGAFLTFSAPLDTVPVVYSVGVPPPKRTGMRCTCNFTLSVCRSLIDVHTFELRYQSLLSNTR